MNDTLIRPAAARARRGRGIALAFTAAAVSGVAIFTNGYAVKVFDDATVYTTAKNAVAAVVLLVVALAAASRPGKGGPPLRPRTRADWLWLGLLGVIGGSVPFVLFFEGLARASSTQAGFIHKTLVVWVALLAVPLLKERLSALHVAAVILLMWGQGALAGDLTTFAFGAGELMVLGATLLWAVEFVVAKRLLGSLSPITVGTGRLGIGLVLLFGLLAVTGRLGAMLSFDATQLGWVVLTGAILAGFVGTWYAALARAQAVDVTAVLVFGAVVTATLAGAFQDVPLGSKSLGLVLVGAGAAAAAAGALRRVGLGTAQ
jgi:drug/metabolite transporter (DMT)-like permease